MNSGYYIENQGKKRENYLKIEIEIESIQWIKEVKRTKFSGKKREKKLKFKLSHNFIFRNSQVYKRNVKTSNKSLDLPECSHSFSQKMDHVRTLW